MNWLTSFFLMKCPHCRRGDLFIKPLKISEPLAMNEACDKCGQPFEPEPGFYYGAMFLSYIVTAFLYLGIIATLIMGFGMGINKAFLILLAFVALTYISSARLARSLWIHLMVGYQKEEE